SLLLPDATVMLVGGNPTRGSYEGHIEIYSPAYLFNGDGSSAARPTISSVSSTAFGYGAAFQVQTPEAANITSVVLVRPGAPTHAFDMDQRLVGLSYTSGAGVLNVTAPPNSNIAPPGYYMLFILNSAGVPSLARFVRLSANQPPTATITSPTGNVTVNPGQSVLFSGTGSDPDGSISSYSWTFPGGNPGSSSLASPGNVTYSTPGTYVASLTVTDNAGTVSQPATRTITVPDFSLTATPTSRTVLAGAGTTYTATVNPGTGFSGTVAFSVTGLPSGTTASFSPASITTSGSTTLTVSTSASTPGGTYTLTIRGTSGPLTHTFNVTLVVSGDFAISVTPSSRTITQGGTATYNVTITAGAGFSGTVTFSVAGAPTRATVTFNPTSVVNSGTSVLTVATFQNVAKRTRTLTITGTSGSRVHSANATLIIQ
ncbi:MAG TPA: galactose oxidase-like domain-containing protein, partial [Terriglobia bacterium]|nr:galactose oxidase-like domain-containing protein [Terriglobia bacterium]